MTALLCIWHAAVLCVVYAIQGGVLILTLCVAARILWGLMLAGAYGIITLARIAAR